MAPTVPRGSTPPDGIVYTLQDSDLMEHRLHLWRNAPHRLPRRTRIWLWVAAIYLGIALVELLVAAAGGIAVAVYFIVRASSDAAQRASGLPGKMLALYIVTASLLLLYGFWPRHFLWRLVAWVLRAFHRLQLKHAGQRAQRRGEFDPAWQYRLSLAPDGLTRIVDQHENKGGIEYFQRRTEFAPWSAIGPIDATLDHVFVGSIGGEIVFIVPARAFTNPRAFDQFVDEARRLRQHAAQPTGSPIGAPSAGQREAAQSGGRAADRSTGITIHVENVSDRNRVGVGPRS